VQDTFCQHPQVSICCMWNASNVAEMNDPEHHPICKAPLWRPRPTECTLIGGLGDGGWEGGERGVGGLHLSLPLAIQVHDTKVDDGPQVGEGVQNLHKVAGVRLW